MTLLGAEISFPVLRSLSSGWEDRLSVAFGAVPDAEEHVHTHGGGEAEAEFEGEGGFFNDWAATLDYTLSFSATSHTRYEFGFSVAVGNNQDERTTQIYGLHAQYFWRADGVLEHSHGWEASEFFRWRTELFLRSAGAVSGHASHVEHAEDNHAHEEQAHAEHHEHGEHDEHEPEHHEEVAAKAYERSERRKNLLDFGLSTTLSYGFPSGKVQTHLRAEYVSGIAETGQPERWHLSPVVAWKPSERLPVHFKVQYNLDHSPDFGTEHSVWAQINLSWGSACLH